VDDEPVGGEADEISGAVGSATDRTAPEAASTSR
jgi:hypothetical protein